MPNETFTAPLQDGDSIERDGFTLTATIEHYSDCGTPWENEDGHGPVSDWTTRAKLPGEVTLASDRGSHRFYDMQEAVRIAARDQWGVSPYRSDIEHGANGLVRINGQWFDNRNRLTALTTDWHDDLSAAWSQLYAMHRGTMSKRQYAALAAERDFERLKAWCNDDWSYIGITVTASRNGIKLASASLWEIESDSGDYLTETANELCKEAISDAQRQLPL